YVREHVLDAMWAIPIVPRQCAIQIEAFEQMFIRILVDRDGATWIVDTRMDGDTGAWVHDAMLEILLHVRGLILTLRGIKREYETISPPLRYESLTYSAIGIASRAIYGEAAQAEAVLMRCAGLLARGWPVTLEHAKRAIERRPSRAAHTCYMAHGING